MKHFTPITLCTLLVLLMLPVALRAQSKIVKDLDGDGKKDKVYLNDSRIVCELSSQKNQKHQKNRKMLAPEIHPEPADFWYLHQTPEGFGLFYHWMRYESSYEFAFDKEAGKMRLTEISHSALGNAVNDGSGESSLDLLTGEYSGTWHYYDVEGDTLIQIPVIEVKMDHPAMYFEDFTDSIFWEKEIALIQEYREKIELESSYPKHRKFLSAEEKENDEWNYKISLSDTLEHYVVQLVTSKEKSDYWTQWKCLQIFERSTGCFVQTIDLTENEHNGYDNITPGDFNFDGHEEFSLFEASYNLGNSSERYFLFDPETKTFFDSGFDGTNLNFNSSTQTITSYNRCCAGTEEYTAEYKLVGNRMVLLEQHLWQAERDENGNPLFDKDGDLIMVEEDSGTSYIDVQLQSAGQKKNFQLRLAIYDEDMAGGFVQYKDSKERIPIHLDRAEDMEEDESYPDGSHARILYYHETYNGESTGVYCFILRNADVDNIYYTRKKDGKVFALNTEKELGIKLKK